VYALTRRYARPPYRVLQVSKAVSVEAMLLNTRIEPLLRNDKTRSNRERRRHGQTEAYILVFHHCAAFYGLCDQSSRQVI
jgi:endonuclease/exonuclease/phosphatase (EEP) superfamily protein YafD